MSITGNDERDRMIYEAIKIAVGNEQVLSADNVKAYLPPDFDLLPLELIGCRRAARLETMAPLVTTLPDGRPLEAAPTPEPEPQAPEPQEPEPETDSRHEAKLTQAQSRAAFEAASKRHDIARVGVRLARSALQAARGKLAQAVQAWQEGGPRWTPEMERRAMVQAYKDGKTGQRPAPRRVANSYIDQVAQHHGDANDAVRKSPVPLGLNGQPGTKGFRRGAYPAQFQHQTVKPQ